MFRKIILSSVFVCSAIILLAQAPQSFNYQAVVKNNSNLPLENQNVSLKISILQGSSSGPSVYSESHSVTTNLNGLVNLKIGQGSVLGGNFSSIVWASNSYYIKLEIDQTGGTNYQLLGTSQLVSVPYALHAKTAESISNKVNVGDFKYGGIVIWVDESGQHGLVCSKTDLNASLSWNNGSNFNTMAKGNSNYSGQMNTAVIIASQGLGSTSSYAALACSQYISNENGFTYGDWYLPSKDELNLIYVNRNIINTTATANGGTSLTTAYYWSSTESDLNNAWNQGFINGFQGAYLKTQGNSVRAVRRF